MLHHIFVEPPFEPRRKWEWDGNVTYPTVHPSINIEAIDPKGKLPREACHYWLKNGKLEFLPDSTHKLAGMRVDLPPLPYYYRDNSLP